MRRRKFSKTGLALIGSMLVCLLICLAVLLPGGGLGGQEAEDLNDADTPDLKTVMKEGSPVLIYDKRPEAQALIAAYESGTIEQIRIQWEDGSEVTADTPFEIREIYRLFKNIVVTGDEEAKSPDGEEIRMVFKVQAGEPCEYTLLGESALAIGDANKSSGDADQSADDLNESSNDANKSSSRISSAEPLIKYLKTLK
ncbi:MAG: hypothetical protein IJ109_02150 [Firmicutes bacterium]|nr:hypothetical protein [Bacillota bacterium]